MDAIDTFSLGHWFQHRQLGGWRDNSGLRALAALFEGLGVSSQHLTRSAPSFVTVPRNPAPLLTSAHMRYRHTHTKHPYVNNVFLTIKKKKKMGS